MDRTVLPKKLTGMGEEDEEGESPKRIPLRSLNNHKLDKSTARINWKQKLREGCCRRVREDRARLLWKMRSKSDQASTEKDFVKSAFKDIVSDELRKIKGSSSGGERQEATDDMLWEYDGLHTAYKGDCEDILLEMQRIFYEDLEREPSEKENGEAWDDEEDEYLAHAVLEYMQLNDAKANKKQTWCPVCKKGEIQENSRQLRCSLCQFQLKRGDEVNLEVLRTRLAEAHEEHLDRGCRSKPEFSVETMFDLTALYIQCHHCSTFEIVI